MARLQILQLPEGASDDRPPFVLVIDETVPQRVALGVDIPWRDPWQDVADKIGARGVIVTPETIDIPANDVLPLPLLSAETDDPERAGTSQIVYAHERTRLDLCSALLVSGDTTWRKLIEMVKERQRELAGILRERYAPDPALADLVFRTLGIELTPGGIPYDEALHNACRQLEKSEASRAHLRDERAALTARLQQVQQAPLGPDAMDAGLEHPNVWLHGYRAGVLAARAAARPRDEATVKP